MKHKYLKWGLIGACLILIASLLIYHLFRDTLAIKQLNSHLQVDDITLWKNQAEAKKRLGYGKRVPTKSLGQVLQYDHLDLQIYYEDSRVAGILTENPNHSVYGIHVGSTAADARLTLEEHRFRLLSDNQLNYDNGNTVVSYTIADGNIIVSYEISDEYVSKLHVQYFNPKNKNKLP